MLSIKPKWCELIASGKKTVEVRKTKPKLDTPFKCYIYCTKCGKDDILWTSGTVGKMSDKSNGKVIGEFVCDFVYENIGYDSEGTCLSADELKRYAKGKPLYAWHISDLVIYDKPKELEKFRHECKSCCIPYLYDMPCENCGDNRVSPPQSWCYVEELR